MPSESTRATATEFVEEAFETAVNEQSRERLLATIDASVATLRKQIGDDTLERIFRADPGSYLLRGSMTRDGLQPESFTQQAVIEPLLDALGYEYATEAGGLSGGRTLVADYTVSLREYDEIDSSRLLIEAEPVNKTLDSREHGVGQVREWLGQREFESDFGFATDGLRWTFIRYDPDSYTHTVIESVDLAPVFLALFYNQVGKRTPLGDAVAEADGERVTRLIRTFERENFVSIASDARRVIKRKQAEITDDFYDDYTRYVFGIVGDDERSTRSLVGDGVVAPDGATTEDVRLFAVELMNRLLFIKFLEDKEVVQPDLLRTLAETYEQGVYGGSLYEEFLKRLFYDVMNEKPTERSANIKNIDLFERVPYLNGGLFRPTIGDDGSEGGERFTERDFDVRNSVLFDVIDLLEGYSFSATGAPTDLDPSVLGNVFEKTINYVTSDNADTNKELGAYYTPSEITRFCAEETVRPALLDRFERVLVAECNWPEHSVGNFDSVYELIEGLPGHMGTIGPLLDAVDDLRVVDPACGSGHFLTSVLAEIVNVRKALYARNESYPHEYRLKKTTVLENIYGVDLMGPAVEIAKLRLWLSIIAELEREDLDRLDDEELALPNIVFNLRQGNSLVGYTGFPETTDSGEYTLGSFSEDSVRERYRDIIEEIEAHEKAIDTETAETHRKRAFEKLREAREGIIGDIHADFVEAGSEGVTLEDVRAMEPFNWVLEFAEVYAEGGFDAIVGNPPWDQLRPNREDFFTRYDERFRTYLPSEKNARQEELLEDEEIAASWESYQERIEVQMRYFTDGPIYELQKPTVAGRKDPNENNLAGLFLERVFAIAGENSYVAQVLPGVIFNGSFSKDLRMKMLREARIDALATFENKGIFDGIDDRYSFGVVAFETSSTTETLTGIFQQHDVEILSNLKEHAIEIPRRVLSEYSPEARSFPFVTDQREVDVLNKLLGHPPLGRDVAGAWSVVPRTEIHRARDADRFVESEDEGDYPIYGGKNIYQFQYDGSVSGKTESPTLWSVEEEVNPEKSAKHRARKREFNGGALKKSIYETFGGHETSKSQKEFVDDLLNEHRGTELNAYDVLPGFDEYRIVYRRVTNPTNERTMIASVLPPNIVCVHSIYTIPPHEISLDVDNLSDDPLHSAYTRTYTSEELFVIIGLLNSIPFDFLMRTKVNLDIIIYKFTESQMPHLTAGDDWFEYIWRRAARLNCYGEAFAEMRERLGGLEPATETDERRRLQAQVDAAAFHAYGLDREQTAFVLDDFHRVQNPRVMDEAYFESVLEFYDELAERGPEP